VRHDTKEDGGGAALRLEPDAKTPDRLTLSFS
jgi:hypothetical protein